MSQDAFRRAAAIAVGIAQSPVGAVYGPSWAYSPGERSFRLTVKPDAAFTDRDKALCAHEAAHLRITRYNQFQPFKDLNFEAYALLLNAIEDPRVQAWAIQVWPGSASWFEALWASERAAGPPNLSGSLFLQFAAGASIADAFGWGLPTRWGLDPRALEALDNTAQARQCYATVELPGQALAADVFAKGGLNHCLAREAAPLLSSEWEGDMPAERAEALILLSAARAFRLARERIAPVAAGLIAQDIAAIRRRSADDPHFAQALADALAGDSEALARLVEQALSGAVGHSAAAVREDELLLPSFLRRLLPAPPGPTRLAADPETLARAAFQRFLARANRDQAAGGGRRVRGPKGDETGPLNEPSRSRGARPANPDLRQRVEETLRTQSTPLLRRLEQAFHPTPRQRPRPGFASGVRPDLKAAMRFEADRRGYDRLWIRQRPVADRRRAAVLLLVDLSASMSGAEIDAAVRGVSLLASVLDRLGGEIALSVQGFQNVLTPPFKDFAQPLGREVLRGFEDMALEVGGARPGGNNRPNGNDDGRCLEEAAQILQRHPHPEKLLIVVSDGQPSARPESADDLRGAIVATRRRGIHLVGLGLGQATAHVADFYAPHFVAQIPPEDFARAIGDVVVGALCQGRGAAGETGSRPLSVARAL